MSTPSEVTRSDSDSGARWDTCLTIDSNTGADFFGCTANLGRRLKTRSTKCMSPILCTRLLGAHTFFGVKLRRCRKVRRHKCSLNLFIWYEYPRHVRPLSVHEPLRPQVGVKACPGLSVPLKLKDLAYSSAVSGGRGEATKNGFVFRRNHFNSNAVSVCPRLADANGDPGDQEAWVQGKTWTGARCTRNKAC